MIDTFWWFVSILIFICALGLLFVLYRLWLGDKYLNAANKLKSQMANIKQTFPELEAKRGSLVASGLGDIGIEGIMDELGIDPGILKNPLVKGLVDKYAPRVLESLSKHGDQSQGQEKYLL